MPGFDFNTGPRVAAQPGQGGGYGARQPAQATGTPNWQTQWAGLQAQKATDPSNRALTAREHDAFSRSLMERFGPVAGRAMVAGTIPAWQGAKAVTQGIGSVVPGSMEFMDRWFPEGLQPQRGSAPGWDQLMTGLRPIWDQSAPSWSPAQAEDQPQWTAEQPQWEGWQ